ncbi:hypothetical protein S245_029887 [Arachis hypogaea]|nr:uncharacterized protein DS421_9g268890 [Arachis hypogaea]
MVEQIVGISQMQREALKKERREERAALVISINRLQNNIISILINRAEKKHLQCPWKHTLIVKLLGMSISYGVLKRQFDMMWVKTGGLDLIDFENIFFVVRL